MTSRRFWPTPRSSPAAIYAENPETRSRRELGGGAVNLADAVMAGQSISSPAASHARISLPPASGPGSPDREAVFSSSSCGSFASWSQDTFFSKMSRALSAVPADTASAQTDAYAAGLIDGEGCISLSRSRSGHYCVRVEVGMSVKAIELLRWLVSVYGGTIRRTRPESERWAEAQCWGVFGGTAEPFLTRMLPHLKLKTEQAKLAICLLRLGADGWTEENWKRAHAIWESMRALNAKGPEQPSESCSLARLAEGTWATAQQMLFGTHGSEPFTENWPRAGMTRNGIAYRRQPLAPRTSATGSGSSPMIATPTETANQLCPSMQKWPGCRAIVATPDANVWKGGNRRGQLTDPKYGLTPNGGQLNPQWVAWLMGFPTGWLDLEPLETASSPK